MSADKWSDNRMGSFHIFITYPTYIILFSIFNFNSDIAVLYIKK